jgi:hypothetical protein
MRAADGHGERVGRWGACDWSQPRAETLANPALPAGIALACRAIMGHDELGPRSTRTAGWRTLMVAALSAVALVVSGLAATSASAETTWLCKPGLVNNPCESSEETTVQLANGSSLVEHAQPASNPPIDCFYLYPTVSSQATINASLKIDPEETQIAIDQASRFSQTCKVYAPIYPQLTLTAISTPGAVTPVTAEKAYLGALSAWQEYLAKYNGGRGVVLIGHSQGALILKQLIKEQIDPNPALRKQLVSAILLGGNVTVPKGKTVGGTFTNVPSCQTAVQTGCVVAYSSFLTEPPEGAFFGRVNSPLLGETITEEEVSKLEVLCVNPAEFAPGKSPGALLRYESTSHFPGLLGQYFQAPKAPTPWVSMPDQYSGQCERVNGATWLQLVNAGFEGDPRELITEPLGPAWGTHLEDVNAALGNLVALTAIQSRAYTGIPQVTSITPTSGSTLGETAVTIKGSGFLAGATVKIGNAATAVNVVSETEVTAKTAATAAGSDEVVVTDANGTSTGGPSYTYYIAPPPPAVTGNASAIAQSTATLNASVNPGGATVSDCHFEYGTTPAYGKSASCASLPGSGGSPVAVSASVTGLTADTTYHFRISATNANGTSKGSDETFKTLGPPTVATEKASAIAEITAALNATVNPNGTTVSDCHFEYGTTPSYGKSASCASLPGSGESPVAVSASITGLSGNTTYHYRISATNAGGTSIGGDQMLLTKFPAHWFVGLGGSSQLPPNSDRLAEGKRLPIITWGGATDLSQESEASSIHCKTVGAGYVENPTGGGDGRGQARLSEYYECHGSCESQVAAAKGPGGALEGVPGEGVASAVAEALPWNYELFIEPGNKSSGIEERVGGPPGSPGEILTTTYCKVEPSGIVMSAVQFEGEVHPSVGPGFNGGGTVENPASAHFNPNPTSPEYSGELPSQALAVGGGARIEGSVRFEGYATNAYIRVKEH